MKPTYDASQIENNIQKKHYKNSTFVVSADFSCEKFYCLSMLPYPSGKIHMGHSRNYTIGDVIARYQRMNGKNVLQPLGWDAFGLPAENAALEHKVSPSEWTKNNIKQMRSELKSLGLAIDWTRELATCNKEYYKWEQWLFLQMYKHDLVYRKKSLVNWDPIDKTVLANEQVVDGKGWRSGAVVEQKEISQWFLKITDYAEELLEGLDSLDQWPEEVKIMQKNWIGKSRGIELTFRLENSDDMIDVFTTRPDTLMGVTYVAISPMHKISIELSKSDNKIKSFIDSYVNSKEKHGIKTNISLIHPITKELVPLWIANFVLSEYGSGAVMSVPAHDDRDFEFAKKYNINIKNVIRPSDNTTHDFSQCAYTEYGILENSGRFDGLSSNEAFDAILEFLESNNLGREKVNYRLRDWGISRQRYWGAPIPMVYCDKCGIVPVDEVSLPVKLPEDVVIERAGQNLSSVEKFVNTKCPKCGGHAKRETDTFDTFMESSWYYARYCCVDQKSEMLDDRAKYWTPVDQYVGGIEHAVMHLLYARFIHKVMRDFGLLNCDEPFVRLLTQGMVLKDGSKMSKSKGNSVALSEMVNKYGADTARMFIMFAAPPEQSLEWSESGVDGINRFLKRIWSFSYSNRSLFDELSKDKVENYINDGLSDYLIEIRREIHLSLKQASADMERNHFNTVVSAGMKLFNIINKIKIVNSEDNLLDVFVLFEGLKILLLILYPIVPHITETIWEELNIGFGESIIDYNWPSVDDDALKSDSVEIIVQVNGKLRDRVEIDFSSSDDEIKKIILSREKIKNYIGGKAIKRFIIVKNKLVNIVI